MASGPAQEPARRDSHPRRADRTASGSRHGESRRLSMVSPLLAWRSRAHRGESSSDVESSCPWRRVFVSSAEDLRCLTKMYRQAITLRQDVEDALRPDQSYQLVRVSPRPIKAKTLPVMTPIRKSWWTSLAAPMMIRTMPTRRIAIPAASWVVCTFLVTAAGGGWEEGPAGVVGC